MELQQLKEQLNKKIEKEYDDFIEKMKLLPPEQIIENSYEKIFKEELVTTVRYKKLSKAEIKALLKMNHPLDSLYHDITNG